MPKRYFLIGYGWRTGIRTGMANLLYTTAGEFPKIKMVRDMVELETMRDKVVIFGISELPYRVNKNDI